MKKLNYLMVTIAIVISCLCLTSCKSDSSVNEVSEYVFSNHDSKLGYEVVSSISMVPQSSAMKKLSNGSITDEVTEETDIKKYLDLMENLLNDNGGFSTVEEASDKEEYTYKVTITTRTITGEVNTYVVYYNEKTFVEPENPDEIPTDPVEEEQEATVTPTFACGNHENDHNPDCDKDEKQFGKGHNEEYDKGHQGNGQCDREDHDEKPFDKEHHEDKDLKDGDVYSIDGIAIVDEQQYLVTGKRVIVNEDGENRSKFQLQIMADENNYVVVTETVEVEGDETEKQYVYNVFADKKLQSSVNMKLEVEDNKTKVQLKEKEQDKKPVMYQFFISEESGIKTINVMIKNDGEKNYSRHILITITFDVESGNYTYEYKYNKKGNNKGRR